MIAGMSSYVASRMVRSILFIHNVLLFLFVMVCLEMLVSGFEIHKVRDDILLVVKHITAIGHVYRAVAIGSDADALHRESILFIM